MQTSYELPTDWSALVFQEGFISSLDRMSQRRFGQNPLAEECTVYVLELLAEDSWKRCQQFQGRSKPTTFLVSLSNNLIEEFARKKFGRHRPPVWLKEQGDLWVKLWKSICLERQMLQTVLDRFCDHGLRTVETVLGIINTIKYRIPSCGESGFGICDTRDGDIEALSDTLGWVSKKHKPATNYELQAQKACFSLLSAILSDGNNACEPLEKGEVFSRFQQNLNSVAKLGQLKLNLDLSNEEVLLLRMVFIDGLSKSKAAISLGMPAHKGGRVINDALNRIRDVFHEVGVDVETLFDGFE